MTRACGHTAWLVTPAPPPTDVAIFCLVVHLRPRPSDTLQGPTSHIAYMHPPQQQLALTAAGSTQSAPPVTSRFVHALFVETPTNVIACVDIIVRCSRAEYSHGSTVFSGLVTTTPSPHMMSPCRARSEGAGSVSRQPGACVGCTWLVVATSRALMWGRRSEHRTPPRPHACVSWRSPPPACSHVGSEHRTPPRPHACVSWRSPPPACPHGAGALHAPSACVSAEVLAIAHRSCVRGRRRAEQPPRTPSHPVASPRVHTALKARLCAPSALCPSVARRHRHRVVLLGVQMV